MSCGHWPPHGKHRFAHILINIVARAIYLKWNQLFSPLPSTFSRSTYSGATLRRSIICIGLLTLGLLSFQTGWETTKIINHKKDLPFTVSMPTVAEILPIDSGIWFDALVQVLFSTNIGIGLLPVVTGKFIYKGDAVRYVNSKQAMPRG